MNATTARAALLAALRAQPEYQDARMMGAPDGDALTIAPTAAQARATATRSRNG